MFKKYNVAMLIASAFILCGCMSVDCVINEEFPPVDEFRKFDKAVDVPYEYTVVGVCQTEGNYTEFSYDDMMDRIGKCAMKNGADGVVLLGMRVVPDGRVVQNSVNASSIVDTSVDGGQWGEISRDFGGGYGSIRSKTYGTAPTYDRIVRAQLIRFKRDEQGEFVKRKAVEKNAEEVKVPLKTRKELKKEAKNAKAN